MADEAEDLERGEVEALHAAAGSALRTALGLALDPFAGGIASRAAALPPSAIVLNRAFGFSRPLDAASASGLVAAYEGAGVGRYFVQISDAASASACRAAGLLPARGWQKFARDADAPLPDPAPGVEIRELAPGDDATAFAGIIAAAFDLGDRALPWLAALPGTPGLRLFLATVDGVPAGTGGLYRRGDAAWTDFGATAPAFRQRGVQRTMLAHRVRVALADGCLRLHTCTGEAVAGEPQHSWNNILRCGFRPTTLRQNWAPPRPAHAA